MKINCKPLRKPLQNEKGNASIYLLWLMGIVALIFVVTINIVKVYVVKEQANLSVEQAALAGTAVLLDKTKEAVTAFDSNPLYTVESAAQRMADGGNGISMLIDEKKLEYMKNGADEADAYMKAANEILPPRLEQYLFLKKEFRDRLGNSPSDIPYLISPAVQDVIDENKGNTGDTEVFFSSSHPRVEVKSTVTFQSISDHKYITAFLKKIPQKGYGPELSYLAKVY